MQSLDIGPPSTMHLDRKEQSYVLSRQYVNQISCHDTDLKDTISGLSVAKVETCV